MKMLKTTITLWQRAGADPLDDLDDLALEVREGAIYCSHVQHQEVKSEEDPEWDGTEFFGVDGEYTFIVDADERGEFAAHVEDPYGEIIAEWTKADCEEGEGFPPIVDGFMKSIRDMEGLRKMLDLPEPPVFRSSHC